MSVSKERIELILGRFSMLFPLPVEHVSQGDLVGLWHGLFCDADEAGFNAAARALALTLRRFPFPADFAEKLYPALVNATQAATETVAQGVAND